MARKRRAKTAKKRKGSHKRKPAHRRKRNPGVQTAVVNPAPRKRRKRHGKKRVNHGKRRHSSKRRSNPGIGGALINMGIGSIGAVISGLAGYVIGKLSISPGWQAIAKAAAGLVVGVPAGMVSPAFGIGLGGGLELQAAMQGAMVLSAPAPQPSAALAADQNQLSAVGLRDRLLAAHEAGMHGVSDLEAVEDLHGLDAVEFQLGAIMGAY